MSQISCCLCSQLACLLNLNQGSNLPTFKFKFYFIEFLEFLTWKVDKFSTIRLNTKQFDLCQSHSCVMVLLNYDVIRFLHVKMHTNEKKSHLGLK